MWDIINKISNYNKKVKKTIHFKASEHAKPVYIRQMKHNYKLNINIIQQQDITLHFTIDRTFDEEKRKAIFLTSQFFSNTQEGCRTRRRVRQNETGHRKWRQFKCFTWLQITGGVSNLVASQVTWIKNSLPFVTLTLKYITWSQREILYNLTLRS